ncbi:DNA ligase 1-like [Achroia grisella]|uniref:DNA ligase 1-like n=1 Tax=Achroia grisella TaxID=688607 RepID=UPI0027D300AB|nr:DNA ligase 1-like [Achroia grisella]
MKSKSYDLDQMSADKDKYNKTYDYLSLYKSAGETNGASIKSGDGMDKENGFITTKSVKQRHERTPSKKKKNKQELLDISRINIEGPHVDTSFNKNTPHNESKVTSTPQSSSKKKDQMKSIIKNSSVLYDSLDSSKKSNKPKKRNKSVSFMLDETEEVVKKKTKSEESLNVDRKDKKGKRSKQDIVKPERNLEENPKLKKNKKVKNVQVRDGSGDSNNMEVNNVDSSVGSSGQRANSQNGKVQKTKIFSKTKSKKSSENTPSTETESNNNEEQTENKHKKNKKKKRVLKSVQINENEPATKTRKVDIKSEVITENLENLRIGDNPDTLSNLLDEMTVAEKDKRKKHKRKLKKDNNKTVPPNASSSDNAELEKNEKEKDKVKWNKRKWNRDKKGEIDDEVIANSVIVENLPLNIMCNYKKLLTEHFQQYGIIKRIGIAEMYPDKSTNNNITFTTTIIFYSDGAATKALEENNRLFEGNNIQVKKKLPPEQTTVVVRSYAPLTDQNISTVFSEAGCIRKIRHLVKGKKSMETVFVEFDKPEAVAKAQEIAKETKIEGKRVHVNKYELRKKKDKPVTADSENGDSDHSSVLVDSTV